MRTPRIAAFLTYVLLTVAPVVVDAQTGEGKSWYDGIKLNGFASATYTHNYNHPDSQLNQLRVFDFHAQKLVFDVGEIVAQKMPIHNNDWGFRLDFAAGSAQPEVSASYGLFRNSDGEAGDVDVHQLFATYVVPVGSGLKVDAGKFVTHLGYEVMEGYDGYNDNTSRSFLFGYGGPFTHTGIRTSYTFNSKVSAVLMFVQGSDVTKDNNSAKSAGTQLAISPNKKWTVFFNYLGGAERSGNNHDLRNTYNVVNVLKPTSKLTVAFDTLYATESNGVAEGHDGSWAGAATFIRYDLSLHWAAAVRAEYFADKYGLRTGTAQRLASVVLTPEYKVPIKLSSRESLIVVRGDIRFDRSSEPVFQFGSDQRRHQFTNSVNLLYVF